MDNDDIDSDQDPIVSNLIKEGKYDEVMKYLREKESNEQGNVLENYNEEMIIPADDISLSLINDTKLNETDQSILLIQNDNNNYEDILHVISSENKIKKDGEQSTYQNLEQLTQELALLEHVEKESEDNLVQMNELYQMLQEDKKSALLQLRRRKEWYPYYNENVIEISEVIQSDIFKEVINNNDKERREINEKIYSKDIDRMVLKIIEDNPINIKSIMSSIEYDEKDVIDPNKIDYNSLLLGYKQDIKCKVFNNDIAQIKEECVKLNTLHDNSNNKYYNRDDILQVLSNREIKITIASNAIVNNQENEEMIFTKVKSWIKNNELNAPNKSLVDNNTRINLSNFNSLFLNTLLKKKYQNKKTDYPSSNLLELTLQNKQLKKIPKDIIISSPNLKFINLEENQIEQISNLEECSSLYSLNLNKNLIKKIENVSQLINLEKLSLNNNSIETIENLQLNQKLKLLSLGKNRIHSIENIEEQILFIEELTLSENNIKFFPEKFSLPYLKYLDLNENKIKRLDNIFFCPCLEKLLLKDNKITGEAPVPLSNCQKVKEIDLSFNKIEYLAYVIGLLYLNRIEIINVSNNPFIMNTGTFCQKIFLRVFPMLDMFNNETISSKIKNKVVGNKDRNKKIRVINHSANFNEAYFNIFINQNFFMKYFNSVYFTNKIFNVFNFNINSHLTIDKIPLLNLINDNYFLFKQNHLRNLLLFFQRDCIVFEENVYLQFDLIRYLFDFKYKLNYIVLSLGIFSRNYKNRKMKYEKIQHTWKMILLRRRLKNAKIKEDDEDNCDDLLNFFNNNNDKSNDERNHVFEWKEKELIEEIEQNINKKKSKIYLKEIKERKNEAKIIEKNAKSDEEIIKEKERNWSKNNKDTNINKQLETIIEGQGEINDLIENSSIENYDDLKSSIKGKASSIYDNTINGNLHINGNGNRIMTTPSDKTTTKSIDNNLNSNNNANDYNIAFGMSKTKYYPQVPNKYRQGDNIHLNVINMNNQVNLPNIIGTSLNRKHTPSNNHQPSSSNRLESNILLPLIKSSAKSDNGSVYGDDKSVKSSNSSSIRFKQMRGKMLPTSVIEAIKKLEEECKLTIKQAKEEWQFTNSQTADLLAKKISKKYKKKINNLIENY